MSIEDLTVRELREAARIVDGGGSSQTIPLETGDTVLVRTVTHYWTGVVVEVTGGFVRLDTAAWIADTGRFSEAFQDGDFSEVEYVGDGVLVAVGAIVDVCPWTHDLPTETK